MSNQKNDGSDLGDRKAPHEVKLTFWKSEEGGITIVPEIWTLSSSTLEDLIEKVEFPLEKESEKKW